MPKKRKRKTPRRKRQHPHVGSAMNIDRRQEPERRAGEIDGRKRKVVYASDCPPCPDCGEPVCKKCKMHYADCPCPGPHS